MSRMLSRIQLRRSYGAIGWSLLDLHGWIVDMVDQISNQRRECPIVTEFAQVGTHHRNRPIPGLANESDRLWVSEFGKRLTRLRGTAPKAITVAWRFGDFL